MATEQDLREIWSRNAVVPDTVHRCVHDLIHDTIQKQTDPSRQAVCAWDGDWTYKELDTHSTLLAHHLSSNLGVGPNVVVPLCFEKSKWMPIAMLAVMKAGGAGLLIDAALPEERLRSMIQQIKPPTLLTSRLHERLSTTLIDTPGATTILSIDETSLAQLPPTNSLQLPAVKPSDMLYIVFTSGSTGAPKGAVVTHSNFSSAVAHQQNALKYASHARIFDFASYAFDNAWSNALHTFVAGCCLCIPSDFDRVNNIVGSFNTLRASCVSLTPSLAQVLRPEQLPTLERLILTGEPLGRHEASKWASSGIATVNIYGPAECSVFATFMELDHDAAAATSSNNTSNSPSIGRGLGLNTWIVDTASLELSPIGSIGELWLEGPLVGQGYLNDVQRTQSVFIQDPSWLSRGAPDHAGRDGRLYRTGDMVQYNSHGGLDYIGRKDAQVKIHGQRFGLGEVEHHISRELTSICSQAQVVVEVVTPQQKSEAVLVAFIAIGDAAALFTSKLELDVRVQKITSDLGERLSTILPAYMIPSAYIPIEKIPMTPTGKVNRQRLREIGSLMWLEELVALNPSRGQLQKPKTKAEQQMQTLWSFILGIDPDSIGSTDTFLQVGGDSLAAIRLIKTAREKDIHLNFGDILGQLRLCDIARAAFKITITQEKAVDPFSLLRPGLDRDQAGRQVSVLCDVDPDQIEDVFPCTPLQEAMLALTAKREGDYIARHCFKLPDSVSLDRLIGALEMVGSVVPSLRTRIVELEGQGLVQVLLRPDSEEHCSKSDNLDAYVSKDLRDSMTLNSPLSRFGIVQDAAKVETYLMWTVHHSVYDGWSMPLVLDKIERGYQGEPLSCSPPFQTFVRHVSLLDRVACSSFWRAQLDAVSASDPSKSSQKRSGVRVNSFRELQTGLLNRHARTSCFPLSTILRLAWAYVIALHCDSTDVTYGAVVAGRGAAVADIEQMTGPTIATVPIRVKLTMEYTVTQALQEIQDQFVAMVPYEQAGLGFIRSLGPEQALACDIQTLLVIQPPRSNHSSYGDSSLKLAEQESTDVIPFSSFPLVIECNLDDNDTGLRIIASYIDGFYSPSEIDRMLQQYIWIAEQMCKQSNERLLALDRICPVDREQIEKWNKFVPIAETRTLNTILSEIASRQPDCFAVETSTGKMTWGELDDLSSRLAARLLSVGVGPETLVPLDVDRSVSSVVSTLAILKAGGAVVNIDSTQPFIRKKTILQSVSAKVAVVCGSPYDKTLYGGIRVICVDWIMLQSLPIVELTTWNTDCQTAAFVIFTSGSTGKPKAIVHEHRSLATSILAHGPYLGYDNKTRMLQLASCAFDIWIYEHMTTLAVGGCVCIPTLDERMNTLGDFIKKMNVNATMSTPTSLRALPTPLPGLTNIALGGEPIALDVVERWKASAKLFNSYGPAETTICSAIEVNPEKNPLATVGVPLGCAFWVCDRDDLSRLAPIGTVGELLIEGPVVARGYLGNPEATSLSFLADHPWLCRLRGLDQVRAYRSGDLVRYNDDGSIVYVSRKDTQVKLRGFRIELGEVEHQLQRLMNGTEVVVEIAHTKNSDKAQLVAFATSSKIDGIQQSRAISNQAGMLLSSSFRIEGAGKILDQLSSILPAYMVPVAILPLQTLPKTASGKIDRKNLRAVFATISSEILASYYEARKFENPCTEMEHVLCGLWAAILDVKAESISRSDSFLRIGGDSIGAMRLVGKARDQGLRLTVADVFKRPRLCDMASTIQLLSPGEQRKEIVEPFSLLYPEIEQCAAISDAASLCRVKINHIKDILPCTPLQEGLLALTTRSSGDYITRLIMELRDEVDLVRFRETWEHIVATTSILCTRMVDLPGQGLVQVVVEDKLRWSSANDCNTLIRNDQQKSMGLGLPLARFGLVVNEMAGDKRYFVWTLHHALYDGWSLPLLLEHFEQAYKGLTRQPLASLGAFIKYVTSLDEASTTDYWKSQLDGCEAVPFPTLPSLAYRPRADRTVKCHVQGLDWPRTDITASTRLRVAWALLLASYTNTTDVVFGATVTGRSAAVDNVERIAGPTIATVPVRVKFDWDQSIDSMLQQSQSQATSMTEFEQVGLQDIRRVSEYAEQASRFQTLLVIQPTRRDEKSTSEVFVDADRIRTAGDADQVGDFTTYALTLRCQLEIDGLQISLSYDSAVLEPAQAERIVNQLDHVLRQLCVDSQPDLILNDIEMASEQDLREIWSWNAVVPQTVQHCVHKTIMEKAWKQPDAPAVCAWDGDLTYGELDELSTRLAHRLVHIGVREQVIVPLCFEKSRWTSVAMLGVMKAGGASVTLDPALPGDRLRTIIQQVSMNQPLDIPVILTSRTYQQLSESLAAVSTTILSIDEASLAHLEMPEIAKRLPEVDSSNMLYVVYTSGSTGVPKGAVISHANFSSHVAHQQKAQGFDQTSRIYDFSSYAFDISWANVLHAFTSGGCLCVPSDSDRKNDLTGSMRRLQVTHAHLTPSTVRILELDAIPSLKVLLLGGEPLPPHEGRAYSKLLDAKNIYGPAECTPDSTIADLRGVNACAPGIGRGIGANTWVVDARNGQRLVPIGGIGELWIEGPIVGQGYLGDQEKTALVFINDPSWLTQGASGADNVGRTGRLYKTGDLVRYNHDGSLAYIARKDTQVKIRGQRVELAEVEHHVRECLMEVNVRIVAEMITPVESDNPTLVVFFGPGKDTSETAKGKFTPGAAFHKLTMDLGERLALRLPIYMVPSAYIPIDELPMTMTGKTDRRQLRRIGSRMSLAHLTTPSESQREKRKPTTEAEQRLQELWASILGLSTSSIGVDDSFFKIGGDSIGAMRVVAAARKQGLFFTVKHMFEEPKLCDLAKLTGHGEGQDWFGDTGGEM